MSADDESPPADLPPGSPVAPVDGLVRDVETMADGRRRITFYSHATPPATTGDSA